MSDRFPDAVILSSRTLILLMAMLAVGSSPTRAASPNLDSKDVQTQIRELITPYMESQLLDGLSIGIVADGKTMTLHFGKASDDGSAPTDETVYEIGSASKVFTGILLADAVQQGKLKLDQSAATLLPKGASLPDKDGKTISLLDLSIHRSGLPRLPSNMKNVGGGNPYSDYTSELAIEFLKNHQLRRVPGEAAEYSNLAVSFLGYLLCHQSGMSYDDLLSDRITGPLKMTDTTVVANKNVLKRLATGHSTPGNATSTWEFADMPGAGGIRSSIVDMIRFAQANLNPPKNDLGKALELAWKQQHEGNAKEFAMGLGWHIARDGSTRWHNGQTGGYHSMIMVNRQFSSAVVVLTNTATMEVDRLAEDLIRMLAGANVEPRTFEKSIDVPVAKMKQCEGRYQLVPGFVFDVTVVNDRLMAQLTGQPSFQVFPKSETEWFYKVVKASITFKKEEAGKYGELELFQNGVRQTAKRMK